ncbi:MAG: hypothetical protein ACXVSU_25540 [Solirubrobacteraceae bacterium]
MVPDADAAVPKVHIPTRRVPLELVLWHAIAEWSVEPKRNDWQALFEDSIGEFELRRRAPQESVTACGVLPIRIDRLQCRGRAARAT